MSGWTGHRAYPYSRHQPRVTLQARSATKALKCDGRRPVMSKPPNAWPPCAEPYLQIGTLPTGPPPGRVPLQGERVGSPTPLWLARVTGPTWSKDSRPDVNEMRARQARGGNPHYERPPASRAQRDDGSLAREVEGADPFVGFFLQRPLEKKATREKLLPTARLQAEAAFRTRKKVQTREEAASINETMRYMTAIGLSPRQEKAVRVATPEVPATEPRGLKVYMRQFGYDPSLVRQSSRPMSARLAR